MTNKRFEIAKLRGDFGEKRRRIRKIRIGYRFRVDCEFEPFHCEFFRRFGNWIRLAFMDAQGFG